MIGVGSEWLESEVGPRRVRARVLETRDGAARAGRAEVADR